MSIKVYAPAIQVTLIKMVSRTNGVAARYTAADREIDLTPYLGDAGVVRTTKSLAEPAGGFSISFADKMEPKAQDSLYALIEPMDMIEIRAAREAWKYAGAPLPLIMRGYVSSIRRSESMGSDGTPRRVVVVQGQDSGKLWLIHGIWWQVPVAEEKPILDVFRMQAASGMDAAVFGATSCLWGTRSCRFRPGQPRSPSSAEPDSSSATKWPPLPTSPKVGKDRMTNDQNSES